MSLASLSLHSEPYAPTGNIGDSGFRKLLGTPSLDLIQTVVREAVQNCCDADKSGNGPEVLIRLRRLDESQTRVMREHALCELPHEAQSRSRLQSFLESPQPTVLEICDFNTTGLGGPTRADCIPPDATSTDFIDFLRNVGTTRDTAQGGGTYGFGKVALYLASHCNTILVDTRTDASSGRERRLMGCHLGAASSKTLSDGSRKRFTGRHWWGYKDAQNALVDPLRDSSAEDLSDALGFTPRDLMRSGTSIMILNPRLPTDDLPQAAAGIVETLLWNFWPRMMESTPARKRINFSVEADGQAVTIPKPEEFPPLDLFCRAMNQIRNDDKPVSTISCGNPRKALGKMAIVKGLRAQRTPLVERDESLFPQHSSHIAVMRPVELVVRYYDGTPLPNTSVEWAGVFVASEEEEVERAFADSEPPAHDDWQPENMPKGRAKTFVNVAVRELKKAANSVANPSINAVGPTDSGPGLAAVSERLGGLLEDGLGDGARPRSGGGSGGSSSRKRRVSRPEFSHLKLVGDKRVAVFTAEVSGDGAEDTLSAEARLVLDGSTSRAALDDATRQPRVLEIRMPSSSISIQSETIGIGTARGTVEVDVMMPEDCAVGLSLDLLDQEAG